MGKNPWGGGGGETPTDATPVFHRVYPRIYRKARGVIRSGSVSNCGGGGDFVKRGEGMVE